MSRYSTCPQLSANFRELEIKVFGGLKTVPEKKAIISELDRQAKKLSLAFETWMIGFVTRETNRIIKENGGDRKKSIDGVRLKFADPIWNEWKPTINKAFKTHFNKS